MYDSQFNSTAIISTNERKLFFFYKKRNFDKSTRSFLENLLDPLLIQTVNDFKRILDLAVGHGILLVKVIAFAADPNSR